MIEIIFKNGKHKHTYKDESHADKVCEVLDRFKDRLGLVGFEAVRLRGQIVKNYDTRVFDGDTLYVWKDNTVIGEMNKILQKWAYVLKRRWVDDDVYVQYHYKGGDRLNKMSPGLCAKVKDGDVNTAAFEILNKLFEHIAYLEHKRGVEETQRKAREALGL